MMTGGLDVLWILLRIGKSLQLLGMPATCQPIFILGIPSSCPSPGFQELQICELKDLMGEEGGRG